MFSSLIGSMTLSRIKRALLPLGFFLGIICGLIYPQDTVTVTVCKISAQSGNLATKPKGLQPADNTLDVFKQKEHESNLSDSVAIKFYRPGTPFKKLEVQPKDSLTVINTLFVYKPKGYDSGKGKFPFVYLLHGWSGAVKDWKVNYDIQKLADKYNMVIVLPEGYYDSWYVNSINKKDLQYEAAFWARIDPFIVKNYRVDPKNRFITGLSMGGHGAVTFYLKNKNKFKAAGSMSGILDLTQFPDNWGIKKRLGELKKNRNLWEKNSALQLLKNYKAKPENLNIFIACGTKDLAFKVNQSFNELAVKKGVPILFLADKGDHNWDYWTSHVDGQMHFFKLISEGKKPAEIKEILKIK
ncbi:MAG: prolyl oligopeptidase family serine peptidase [Ignavibacteriales bacterium]|nr:MAG: prolyl oligopeptidase family serine peptidase [Ignavibacteriaceae bacterium]MBW7873626.1 prolyl oligopeptidase family serine peptidase [Ignavibacteria bacterium]MCZ2143856.1 prolyl oligopeptidase family serine peptidase [Ignavibacteriales bacterium]OQY79358.1 MAG: hypothetical protein B6D45_00895 [Ignavibacteriales bacterium UTCHB3]MBV6445873.1 hypothetical protein [Ignavibacteriaceae bacterium]